MSSGERKANRLAGESSPYLLQHAHNPVQWWPWGEPAFAEARRRGVPILLSVGYSTCYWCHVMERECFENEEIAKVMNDRFVSIKLDREERPDVDDIYMNALLVTRGNGGWPMNVFLEPTNLRPFWCGTYFPPAPARGMPSWTQILEGISEAWQGRRDEVVAQADQIAEAVRENLSASIGNAVIGEEQIGGALQQLLATFDKVNGGFGGAPKFPQPAYLEFLQDAIEVAGDEQTRDAIFLCLKKTLDGMLCGGVYDQVGGGFHRYSVDATWTVPHFEKMLYDNAQLAAVYARGTAIDSLGEYERVARGTFDYVLREMTSPEGAFYSAQDAEVDGQEGLNYVWTMGELEAALQDPADVSLAARVYGVDKGPNFQDPHHPGNAPVSVLRLEDRLDRVAPKVNMEVSVLRERLAEINAKLYAARAQRTQPCRDDKVLASWNGLMISALARARHDLGEPRYLEAAERAAQFVLREMVDKGSGRLLRSWRAGRGGPRGFLEDSALVILAMIDVAEQRADHEGQPSAMTASYLAAAEHLALQAVEDFKEVKDGRVRWCDTRAGEGDLFVRTSAMHDGVMPSGPSAMLDALLSLAMMTHKDVWKREARDLLLSISGAIAQSPLGSINATRGLIRVLRNAEMKGWVLELKASGAAVVQTPPAMAALATATNKGALPVEVYAAVDRVVVQEGVPAEFRIVLKIADGHHVLAAEPGAGGEGLVPLRVGIVHGSGVVAYADYPEGELYQGAIRVYRGTVEFAVVLEYVGPWKGRPLVAITYQACTDTECLLPVTVELDVAVDLQKQ